MTSGNEWQGHVGGTWARLTTETDRSFAALTARLLANITALPGEMVLDIGCGAGELALAVAGARPTARVTGIDISPDLVRVARACGAGLANCRFAEADAADWAEPGCAPDLLISRHGVMFFADPSAAFAHLAGIAAPNAHLCFSCFQSRERNGWADGLVRLLPDAPPAPPQGDGFAPGPFAFGNRDRVAGMLRGAGWADVAFEPVEYPYIAGISGDGGMDAVAAALAFFARIGPAAPVLAALAPDARAAADSRITAWLAEHLADGRVALPAAAWIVTARRA